MGCTFYNEFNLVSERELGKDFSMLDGLTFTNSFISDATYFPSIFFFGEIYFTNRNYAKTPLTEKRSQFVIPTKVGIHFSFIFAKEMPAFASMPCGFYDLA